jgi:ribose transport system substrate-binding protein
MTDGARAPRPRRSIRRGIAAILVAGSIACGGAHPTSTRNVVGVTLLTQTDDFYKELEAGLNEEAAAKGLDLVIVACEMDPAKQASQIEDFVAQHVAAILAAPCDSSAIVPALEGPAQANIPVFTVDIAAHGGKVVSHVASDNVQGGRLAAGALAAAIHNQGSVAIIDQPTVASVQERVQGFEEGLAKYPGIKIVAKPNADGQRAHAAQVMEDLLQSHRDLKGVFGINDPTALGAAGVIEGAHRTDVAVVGYDATDEAQAAIKKGGPLKADVIQYPRRLGTTVIDVIATSLGGGHVDAVVQIPVGIVDAASLRSGGR